MNNITPLFEQVYVPTKALLIYQTLEQQCDTYVEAYDLDENGSPVNAHPLSLQECTTLAKSLAASKELKCSFLQSRGLLPERLLYTDVGLGGYAVWYSPAQTVQLYFDDGLGIPCGMASVPSMIWKADRETLYVFVHKGKGRPKLDTQLFNAPFFNIHASGKVCMGTVDIEFTDEVGLEDFIRQWEHLFFNSYFSHSIGGHLPSKQNIVGLWQGLIGSDEPFPETTLIKTNRSLKDLLT